MIQIRADLSVPSLSVLLMVGFGLLPIFFATKALSEPLSVLTRVAPKPAPFRV